MSIEKDTYSKYTNRKRLWKVGCVHEKSVSGFAGRFF